MKAIVVGCPYTDLRPIHEHIQHVAPSVRVVNARDVTRVGFCKIHVLGEALAISEIGASFVRYPYDLIPPHSESFVLRERTEYYKSLALVVDHVALNPVATTWMLRNRIFSLLQAARAGARVPRSEAISAPAPDIHELPEAGREVAVKAIGNCFVTDKAIALGDDQHTFVERAEDDGDTAYIFPASRVDATQVRVLAEVFGCAFVQMPVNVSVEFRGYLVGKSFFLFERSPCDEFDKSAASYEETAYQLTETTAEALLQVAQENTMSYLCFDVVLDHAGREWLLDLNPYGSLPPYDAHPGPTDELSLCLLELVQ